jgi:hypothetical protein
VYAKIFRQIFESSIADKPDVRFTFMDLLILADKDGVVDMTHEAISRITVRPIEVIRATITELEGPDPRSRTPDEGGARIKRLDEHRDWGWMILNYDTFRAIANEEQRRVNNRLRVQKHRINARKNNECNAFALQSITEALPHAYAYASSSEYKEGSTEGRIPVSLDCPEFRQAWDEWGQHRIEKRKKMTPLCESKLLSRCVEWGVDRSIAAINNSIANGYQGLFESKIIQQSQHPNGADKVVKEKELERILSRMKVLTDSVESHCEMRPAAKEEYRNLKTRRDLLKGELGVKY